MGIVHKNIGRVRTFYYKAKTTSVYQRLQMLKSLY